MRVLGAERPGFEQRKVGCGRSGGETPAGRCGPGHLSSIGRAVTGIMPPQNTMDSITEITNIGKICSLERGQCR